LHREKDKEIESMKQQIDRLKEKVIEENEE